ncbi:PAS domain-containing sensor histidine kinase [Natrinema versiforme]|uniref:PAS domain-containing sensor histidine kinase n=1 Tax=Natrinema versiforme TaxID=88724 RepID=UPI000A045241|nr:PAS domain-containing sensor histidine kinase [Natrinema versiforme]
MGDKSSDKKTLHPQKPYFQTIFDDPNALMAVLAPDGTIQRVNRPAVDLVSPTETDLIGIPWWEGPWWKHSQVVQDDIRRRVEEAATGKYVEFRSKYYAKYDKQRLTRGILRPVMNDGQIVSIIASGRDITDHVHQQQRLDVLQRILRHNFRNSLNIIHGYSEEIIDAFSQSDDVQKQEEVKRMAEMIADQTMSLTQSAEKIQRLEQHATKGLEQISIETLFIQVTEDIQGDYPNCIINNTIHQTGIEVPTEFTTAVVEAITNAIQYHPESAPTIELRADVVTKTHPPHVELCIADDGPGIPMSEVEPVLSGKETPLSHTSGIGLWLIKWITEQHGGDLEITSNESQGNQITIMYPVPSLSQ